MRRGPQFRIPLTAVGAVLVATCAFAQFGTQDASILAISAWDFQAKSSSQGWDVDNYYRYSTGGVVEWAAGVQLPSGVKVTALELEACDTNPNAGVSATFVQCPAGSDPTTHCAFPAQVSTGAAETPGCGLFLEDLASSDIAIDNSASSYLINLAVFGSSTTSMRSVRLHYKRQVSPAPATATFADVPTSHPSFQFIEALYSSGITAGCGGGNYCPGNTLTRGQMAVFLGKALGLHWPD